jgi:hypothetical protein
MIIHNAMVLGKLEVDPNFTKENHILRNGLFLDEWICQLTKLSDLGQHQSTQKTPK